MIYLQLFWSFLQVGLFSIGGGYAAMPLIQAQMVEKHGWITMNEFADLITIAEMTPGPIAVNSATFVGIRIAGIPGAIVATLGCILPSIVIVSLLFYVYFKYRELSVLESVLAALRATVVALILSAGLDLLKNAGLDRCRIICGGICDSAHPKMESHSCNVPVRGYRVGDSDDCEGVNGVKMRLFIRQA